MTEQNRSEVLPRFFHCSKQEAKQVAVEIRPATVVPRRTQLRHPRSRPQSNQLLRQFIRMNFRWPGPTHRGPSSSRSPPR